uniref:Bestrophin homolog n=1 Tax=Angiostrongylus cantonensis TaxID=6313 RepID=A0A0K0CYL2_ANGCA
MPTSLKRIPRSLSVPVFRKTPRRLVNVLLFKLRDMRVATVGALSAGLRLITASLMSNYEQWVFNLKPAVRIYFAVSD